MYIVYDDMNEYATVAIRCYEALKKNECERCPFFDWCGAALDGDLDNAAVRCGEIRYRKEKNNG